MRRWIALGLAVAAIAGGTVVWRCRAPATGSPQAVGGRTARVTLDVEGIRRKRDSRLAKAKELAMRYRPVERRKRTGPSENMSFVDPVCLLGTPDVCLSLVTLIEDCDAKMGEACLALGQFLQETPPRVIIAPLFFKYACDAGVADGCTRWEELTKGQPRPCEDDLFGCGWRAFKSGNRLEQERACEMGFGELCLNVAVAHTDRKEDIRPYLEDACQLDAIGGCMMLGALTHPDCNHETEAVHRHDCLAPDEESARAALAVACEGGLKEACR